MSQVHYGDMNNKTAEGNFIDSSVNNINNHIGDSITHITYRDRSNALKDLLSNTVIAATHDSSERDKASRCHPDTRVAVKAHIMACAGYGGVGTTEKRIMWLSGPAGAGKTAIMGTVAEELRVMGKLAGTFFFSSSSTVEGRATKEHFITTLAYQLIQHKGFERIRDAVLSSIENDPSIFEHGLERQMEILILNPLRECRLQNDAFPNVFVIDGIDECGVPMHDHLSGKELLDAQLWREEDQTEVLSILMDAVKDGAFPFRILIASRPEPRIKRFFSSSASHCHEIFLDDAYDPDADITTFFNARFLKIRQDLDISSSWPGEDVIHKLVRNASGQFIYAATVIRFIEAGHSTPQNQLEFVLDINPGRHLDALGLLDVLYARVLKSCPDPILALKWLTAHERLSDMHFGPEKAWFWCRLCETTEGETIFLLRYLSALLRVSDLGIPYKASIVFYHKSFQDFISEPRRYGKRFPEFDDGVAQQWLKDQFTWVFENNSPKVSLRHPYHHEVFLAVSRPYWCALNRQPYRRDPTTRRMYNTSYSDEELDTDVVILLIGRGGAGTSSLLRQLTNSPDMRVENKDASYVFEVQATALSQAPGRYEALNEALGGRRIVFADTPAIEDLQVGSSDDSIFSSIVQWLGESYGRGSFIGGTMYIHNVSSDGGHGWLEDIQPCRQIFQEPALSTSQVLLLTTKWDRIDGTPAEVDRLFNHLKKLPEQFRTMIAQGRLSVHHLIGRYGPDVPMLDLEDPWEVIQNVVTTMHGRDIAHRIRRMQDALKSKPNRSKQSEAKSGLHEILQTLHVRTQKLQGQGGTDALWDELHWEVIKLKKDHPELDLLDSKNSSHVRRSGFRRWLHWFCQ